MADSAMILKRIVRKLERISSRFELGKKMWLAAYSTLPQTPVFRWWRGNLKNRLSFHLQKSDVQVIEFQGAQLLVHWSDFPPIGSGPSASLYILEEEVMRLDCFGGEDGHMHFNPPQLTLVNRLDSNKTPRIYFPPGSRQEHVDRAAFELKKNVVAALEMNLLPEIQNYRLDAHEVEAAAERMHGLMTNMLTQELVKV